MWIKNCFKAFNNWRKNTKEEEEYRDVQVKFCRICCKIILEGVGLDKKNS